MNRAMLMEDEKSGPPVAALKRRNGRKPKFIRGSQIPIPAGFVLLSQAIGAAVQLELQGVDTKSAVKQVGLTKSAYAYGRDVVLLAKCEELDSHEMSVVRKAIGELDETKQVRAAYHMVLPIADRVWGRKGHRIGNKKRKRERDDFQSSISFLLSTCGSAPDINIPYLNKEDVEAAIQELKEAETALFRLRERINQRNK